MNVFLFYFSMSSIIGFEKTFMEFSKIKFKNSKPCRLLTEFINLKLDFKYVLQNNLIHKGYRKEYLKRISFRKKHIELYKL